MLDGREAAVGSLAFVRSQIAVPVMAARLAAPGVTIPVAEGQSSAWSPDGPRIAYVRNRRVRVTDGIDDIEPGRGTMPAHWRPEAATP